MECELSLEELKKLDTKIYKQGTLIIKSLKGSKSWQKFFCVVQGFKCICFKSFEKYETLTQPLLSIELDGVVLGVEKTKDKQFITITQNDEVVFVLEPVDNDIKTWIAALDDSLVGIQRDKIWKIDKMIAASEKWLNKIDDGQDHIPEEVRASNDRVQKEIATLKQTAMIMRQGLVVDRKAIRAGYHDQLQKVQERIH